MAAWLSQRSTILSTFSASAINYSTLSGSAITLNSTMISLGASTNSVYTRLSQGNFNSSVSTSSWVSSLTNRVSTTTVAMSANAQYQLALSQSSISTSVMFTSTLGTSWSTLSGASGLPNFSTVSYTAGAVSGDGQYGVLGTSNNNLYRTTNYGQSWSNTNLSTIAVYLPFDTVPASAGTYTDTTGRSAVTYTGPPTQAPTYVTGTGAIRLANAAPGGTPTQYIRGTWNNIGLTSYTISFWVNIQSYGTAQNYIFSAYNAALSIYTITGTNQLSSTIPIAASPYYTIFTIPNYTVLPVNTWHNITIIYQSAGTCYFYLNNALYGTVAGAGLFAQGTSGLFSLASFDNSVNNAFNGYIDDLKIYNSAIFTLPSPLSFTYSSVAVSNSGQYMLATVTNGGLYMSSNFGSTWSQVTGAMLSAIWSNAQVSATGQYMLVNAAPVIVQPQLSGLSTALWQTNGISWTASASSSQGLTTAPHLAFNNAVGSNNTWASAGNYIAGTGAYNGTTSTTFVNGSYTGGAITGEWLQIQSSTPIVMNSYSFANGGNAGGNQAPRIYQIVGSNDGTIWYPIQSVTDTGNPYTAVNTYTNTIIVNSPGTIAGSNGSSYAVTTTIYTTGAYLYFRLCVNATIPGSFSAAELGEWVINFQAGGQTYSTNYGATWSNQPALYSQQMLMPGPTVSPQQTGLTGDTTTATSVVQTTWVQNGISWTSNASSTILAAGYQPWVAFNNVGTASTIPYSWASLANYTAGIYNTAGKTPTPISSPGPGDYYGEWLQIQSGVPLIMYSYNFASGGAFTNMAKTYFIVGSTNGSTWVPIQSVTLSSNPFNANSTNASSSAIIVNSSASQTINGGVAVSFTPTVYSTTANAYNYFRIIANTTFGGAFELNEWYVNFLNPNSIAASITYPSTTLALSESGQYALSATVSNPVLLGELNFEETAPAAYADSIGGLTYTPPLSVLTGITISNTAKVGSNSLSIVNTAGQNGSNSYLLYTLPSFFATLPNAFTISAWINPSSLPTSNTSAPISLTGVGGTLCDIYITPAGLIGIEFFTTTNPLQANIVRILTSSSITIRVWTHVAGVVSNGMAYLYINGTLQNSISYTGIISVQTYGLPATTLIVGSVVGLYNQYDGLIDNLRIYNSALTPQQIQTIYANNVSSTTLTQISPSFSVTPQQTGLTANTWNQGGINWTVSVSSNFDSASKPYALFNNTINFAGNDVWSSVSGGYSGTPGTYNFSTTTYVSGLGAILGEWFQLQSSAPLVMYSYSYTCYNQVGIAKTYYIVGSNDGSTWFPIQLATFPGATNPFTFPGQSQTNFTLVNFNGTQTVIAGTSASLTTTTYSTTTNAYTYFRVIATQIFAGTIAGLFQYSEFAPIFTGPTNTSFYNVISPITNLSTGSSVTAGTIPGVITNSAISNTGQYMALITNNTSGHNVYYSTNYGTTFTGLQLGTSVLTSCAMSYDGSYITIASGATVYTLNNNSTGFSVALGNQAGYQNQANNAIAIGNYAGYQNQTANSIILNASGQGALGTGLNAVMQGFYVAPIASCVASSSQSFSILGYGSDNQVVQTGLTVLPDTGTFNLNAPVGSTTSGILSSRYYLWSVGDNQDDAGTSNNVYGPWYGVGLSGIPGFTNVPCLCGFYGVSMRSGSGYIILTEAGRVGIGTTDPATTLHVSGASNTYTNGQLFISDANYPGNQLRLFSYWGGQISTSFTTIQSMYDTTPNRLAINPNGGNVGIGTMNPGYTLDVFGTARIFSTTSQPLVLWNPSGPYNWFVGPQNDGTFKIVAGTFGGVQLTWGGTSWGTTSDRRIKEDILSLTDCLSKIKSLNPVSFYYINRPSTTVTKTLGLIAQEVIDIIPEVISSYIDNDTKSTYYSITYTELIPVLIGAIKELTEENTTLESTLTSQQTQIDALVQRLTAANIA